MDAKEAIRYMVKQKVDCATRYGDNRVMACYQMAIEALEKVETLEAENARLREKETPKEPRYVKEGYAYCPNCGDNVNEWLEYQNEFISYKFCSNCGQAINNDKE